MLVFCHRMSSEKPSWLKSPVPIAFQSVPGLGLTGPPPIKVLPLISQIELWPVPVFCHRMSELPSLLKSPVPTARQLGPGLGVTGPPPRNVLPSISQSEAWPVLAFCQRMLLIIGVTEGVVAKPLPVISTTAPVELTPPLCVVAKRLPLASATRLAPNPTPFAPALKLTTISGVLS